MVTTQNPRHPDADNVRHFPDPAQRAQPPQPSALGPVVRDIYAERDGALIWAKPTRGGGVEYVELADFIARIVADVAEDDGSGEVRRAYAVEAIVGGQARRITVPADRFDRMGWVAEQLGAGAVLAAGTALRDRARAAVQRLSTDREERTVYRHLGWRALPSGWAYLHAGGAIGGDGAVPGVETRPGGALDGYRLPDPPTGVDLAAAVRASLAVLAVAPDAVTVPLLAAAYRAAFGGVDFSLFLAGPTGAGKSELAALAQQHYGAALDARHLPESWASTANALAEAQFLAKDALLVIDDFAPAGGQYDQARLHQAADRVLRGAGNNAGRGRMNANAELRPSRPARCLVLATGEDVPRGQSARARALIVELDAGTLDWGRLTACQRDAASGRYAGALAGFLRWLALDYDRNQSALRARQDELRAGVAGVGPHRRTPDIAAKLAAGWHAFLDFAVEAGAVSEAEAAALRERGLAALTAAAAQQAGQQGASEPAGHFLDLLSSALSAGKAHVARPGGGEPPDARAWGWRAVPDGAVTVEGERWDLVWREQGPCVGWLDGDDLYLDKQAAYAAAQQLGRDIGDPLAVTVQTLAKRLREQGNLASVDDARQTLTVRKTIAGRRREVLHLSTAALAASD
jgi:hypothetical protein